MKKEFPLLCAGSVVRNFLNVEVGSWPARAIDASKPFQFQDRRPIKKCTSTRTGLFQINIGNGVDGIVNTAYLIQNAPAKLGDVFYVRESFMRNGASVLYRADWPETKNLGIADGKWTPSIHMPKGLSRIHLEVMRVRVERACDISEEDAIAEGQTTPWAADEFQSLWESLYGPDAWDKWCWVYDLRRVK